MKKCNSFIALYRVSTQKQGMSGLGLGSQMQSVRSYLKSIEGYLIEEFQEVESGGNKDRIQFNKKYTIESLLKKRPVLKQVIETAKRENACIIVKEASRLTRFPLLMEHIIAQHIDFVAADSPYDDTTILRLKTALNAQELIKISERTYNSLQHKKKLSPTGKLVKPNNSTSEGRRKGTETILKNSKDANYQIWDKVRDLSTKTDNGIRKYPTLQTIADEMNRLRYTTVLGKKFTTTTILRLLNKDFDNS